MRRKTTTVALALIAVILIVGALIAFLYFFETSRRVKNELNDLHETVNAYESSLTDVYILLNDVKAGNYVQESDILKTRVPQEAVPQNAVTDAGQMEGKLYKTDLSANMYLTEDLLSDMVLTDDMRELDVVMTEVPIGLEVGDYIDVRIAFPLGQDFIALPHKKVVAINGNVVKLIVEEVDFYANESMKADYGSYQAVKIYGAKYVEAGIQIGATAYYPVSTDILKTEILDPNINTSDYSNTLKRRKELEEQLIAAELVEKNDKVTGNKEKLEDMYDDAEKVYAALQEQKEQEAALEANGQSKEELTGLN